MNNKKSHHLHISKIKTRINFSQSQQALLQMFHVIQYGIAAKMRRREFITRNGKIFKNEPRESQDPGKSDEARNSSEYMDMTREKKNTERGRTVVCTNDKVRHSRSRPREMHDVT